MPSEKDREKSGFGFSDDASEYRLLSDKSIWRDKSLSPDVSPDEIARGNAALLALLRLGSPSVGYHDLALIGRAPLNYLSRAAFSFWFIGPTCTHKTANLAILESAFGNERTFENLSGASWEDKAASIEYAQWERNGMLLSIDDFVATDRRMNGKARDFIRLSGNAKGRGRGNWKKEGGLEAAPTKEPRALCVSTGEVEPQVTPSNVARMFINRIAENDLSLQDVIHFHVSGHARNLHFGFMGYVKYLMDAMQTNTLTPDTLRSRILSYQTGAFAGPFHDRTPRNAAELMTGFTFILHYLKSTGAISEDDVSRYSDGYQKLLMKQISERSVIDSESARLENPASMTLGGISGAIDSQRCYLVSRDKNAIVTSPRFTGMEFIGWFDERGLYLLPLPALKVAKQYYSPCGTWSVPKFYQVMDESGFLIRTQKTKSRSTKIRLESTFVRVMHLRRDALENVYQDSAEASVDADEPTSMPDDVRLAPSDNDDMQSALEESPGALQVLEVDSEWRHEINASDQHIRLARKEDSPSDILSFIRRA